VFYRIGSRSNAIKKLVIGFTSCLLTFAEASEVIKALFILSKSLMASNPSGQNFGGVGWVQLLKVVEFVRENNETI
jgi:hypothetical protein